MAGLDLNAILGRSITNIVSESKNEKVVVEESESSKIDESVKQFSQLSVLDLNLDLESMVVEEEQSLILDEKIINNLKGAIGAGVATMAVLEARQVSRR